MNKLKLNISDKAKDDIQKITDYIAKDNLWAAKAMTVFLYKVCTNLTTFPDIGVSRPDFSYKDYRFYTIKKHYVIIYKVEKDALYIARVLSTYQDICALL